MAAFQAVSKDPSKISDYENNPKVKSVIERLKTKFGAGMPGFDGPSGSPFGGAPFGGPGSAPFGGGGAGGTGGASSSSFTPSSADVSIAVSLKPFHYVSTGDQ
jgi:hypothetical protein